MKTCIYSFYIDYKEEAERMARSVKKFHPEIPVLLFNKEQTLEALNTSASAYPHFGMKCAEDYDLVIHLDADTIMTGPIDELLNAEYEVAGTRDTNDHGKAGMEGAHNWPGLDPYDYVNIGVFAVRSKAFFKEWNEVTNREGPTTAFFDNGTFNKVMHNGKYNKLIIDAKGSGVYYNLASVYGNTTHWDSWKNIELKDGKLILDNNVIKVLHMAGGGGVGKFNFQRLFKPEIAEYLETIGR